MFSLDNFFKSAKLFFGYLAIGLAYMAFFKLLLGPKDLAANFGRILWTHTAMLLGIFALDLFLAKIMTGRFWRLVVIYFIAGLAGLILIEWKIVGNKDFIVIGQICLFSYWAGLAILPKLLLLENKREDFFLSFFVHLAAVFFFFVSLGGFFYFFFHWPETWKAMIMLFFFFANVVFWREIIKLRIRNEEREQPN